MSPLSFRRAECAQPVISFSHITPLNSAGDIAQSGTLNPRGNRNSLWTHCPSRADCTYIALNDDAIDQLVEHFKNIHYSPADLAIFHGTLDTTVTKLQIDEMYFGPMLLEYFDYSLFGSTKRSYLNQVAIDLFDNDFKKTASQTGENLRDVISFCAECFEQDYINNDSSSIDRFRQDINLKHPDEAHAIALRLPSAAVRGSIAVNREFVVLADYLNSKTAMRAA